uniref:hypothetical protein n=1 Tax=Streptomyces tubercidicus TaxID=47759 RepID=UPI0037DCE5CA|nr:hypothetical protein OG690_38195 [Streptomyces tubercidicus]
MRELRLIDPYGATVPGTQHYDVPKANVPELEDRLRNEVAPAHAADNDGINGYRFYAADYRVQETPEPAAVTRGTFLDLLATSAA